MIDRYSYDSNEKEEEHAIDIMFERQPIMRKTYDRTYWNVNSYSDDIIMKKERKAPLILLSLMIHILPTLILLTLFYIVEAYGYASIKFINLDQIMKLMTSPLFKSIFFFAWGIVFILTLIILHCNEDRIRNTIFAGIYYCILTIEMTLLFVVTVICISSDSEVGRIASYQIGVVLFNLLLASFIWFLISMVLLCLKRDTFDFIIKFVIGLVQMVCYLVLYPIYGGVIELDPAKDADDKTRIIAIICSGLAFGIIMVGLLIHLFFTIRGKHRLFGQNRGPILIDYYRYDPKISSLSYSISMYNDLAWCLKQIARGLFRISPIRSQS